MPKKPKQIKLRNFIALAHSLRGAAGSGYHTENRKKERRLWKNRTRKLSGDQGVRDVEEE